MADRSSETRSGQATPASSQTQISPASPTCRDDPHHDNRSVCRSSDWAVCDSQTAPRTRHDYSHEHGYRHDHMHYMRCRTATPTATPSGCENLTRHPSLSCIMVLGPGSRRLFWAQCPSPSVAASTTGPLVPRARTRLCENRLWEPSSLQDGMIRASALG